MSTVLSGTSPTTKCLTPPMTLTPRSETAPERARMHPSAIHGGVLNRGFQGLENRCGATYREFESRSLRHPLPPKYRLALSGRWRRCCAIRPLA